MDTKFQKWINDNEPRPEMRWRDSWRGQVFFVRDVLAPLVATGLTYEEARNAEIVDVISTHRSKSIELPVYSLERRDLGLRLILRDNFYNWKLSVLSERMVPRAFDGLFRTSPPVDRDYTGDPLAPCYFEGFPRDLIFGYYEVSDGKRWSAEIQGPHDLYLVVFLILRALGAIEPCGWCTRESHAAAMNERGRRDKAARAAREARVS